MPLGRFRPMQIAITHHVDASEPDAQGMYDYCYEYDVFRFAADGVTFVARSYVDEPEEAHFLRIEVDGSARRMTSDDLSRPLLRQAALHLQSIGKKSLTWLGGGGAGYLALELSLCE